MKKKKRKKAVEFKKVEFPIKFDTVKSGCYIA